MQPHAEALRDELGIALDMLEDKGRAVLLVGVMAHDSEITRAWTSSKSATRAEILGMILALRRQMRDLAKRAGISTDELDDWDTTLAS